MITREKQSLITTVYTKKTSNGECINYNSVCPERYKTGVIKTLLHRAYLVCSTWEAFTIEVDRLKQLFVNNNYPMNIVDNTIKTFINNKFNRKAQLPSSCMSTVVTMTTAEPPSNSNSAQDHNISNSYTGPIIDSGKVVGEYIIESERSTKWKRAEEECNEDSSSSSTTDSTSIITETTPNLEIQGAIQKLTHSNMDIKPKSNRSSATEQTISNSNVKLFFQNQMTANYKQDEKNLNNIISKYVQPSSSNSRVSLHIYYKNRKLKNLFIRNKPSNSEQHSVVYKYECKMEPCNSSHVYIGHTTTLLKQRMTSHTQQGSIRKHFIAVHNSKPKTQDLLSNTTVLARFTNRNELQIAEALLIRKLKPSLNEQNEFTDRTLKIF